MEVQLAVAVQELVVVGVEELEELMVAWIITGVPGETPRVGRNQRWGH